jgi:hypothetical protein
VIQAWLLPLGAPGSLQAVVLGSLAANPVATAQLLAAAGITLPPSPPPELVGGTVLRLLAYNILGTRDAQQQLGGQPFDNTDRIYPSPVDNAAVPRFAADQPALSHMKAMLTTDGKLSIPVVTIHNLFDPVVPYGQEALYAVKVQQAGASGLLTQVPGAQLSSPFGHCTFTLAEVQGAFGLLASRQSIALRAHSVGGPPAQLGFGLRQPTVAKLEVLRVERAADQPPFRALDPFGPDDVRHRGGLDPHAGRDAREDMR